MKRQALKNREIDKLGQSLVKASRMAASEAEQAAADPALYGKVLKRILDDQREEPYVAKLGWQVPAICSTIVALAAGTFLLMPSSSEPADVVKGPEPPPARTESPEAMTPAVEDIEPERVSVRNNELPVPRRSRRAATRRAEEMPEPKPVPEFFEIGFAGGLDDAAMDGRVVRVELPRAALFAMGVNVPLENGTGALTAELLVGPDGAPKAIRLVE